MLRPWGPTRDGWLLPAPAVQSSLPGTEPTRVAEAGKSSPGSAGTICIETGVGAPARPGPQSLFCTSVSISGVQPGGVPGRVGRGVLGHTHSALTLTGAEELKSKRPKQPHHVLSSRARVGLSSKLCLV